MLNKINFLTIRRAALALALVIVTGIVTNSVSAMAGNFNLNDEILQNVANALGNARTASQSAAGALATAREAEQTAQRANALINGAVNQATQAMQAEAAQIRQNLEKNARDAATNAANGVRDQLRDHVTDAQTHVRRANTHANDAERHKNDARNAATSAARDVRAELNNIVQQAEQHRDNARQALNTVNQRITDAYNQMEPRLRQAAVANAQQVEQARQQVITDQQEERNRNELQLHGQKAAIDLENNLRVAEEQARLNHENKMNALRTAEGRDAFRTKHEIKAREEAAAAIRQTEIKWGKIQEMFGSFGNGFTELTSDPKRMTKVGAAVIGTTAGFYAAKHGIPVLISHLVQPKVVSETSRKSWFGWKPPLETIKIEDLTFKSQLQKQLLDLALRVKTAKEFNESLPNVLFFGAPGTGKTAFAKALAYWSGLDYALTSGSEFAKITDLNLANNELRKLIEWGKTSKKGLIIFIDEAESLFANRLLPSTSKHVQDFINTFLAQIPEKSQKNLMFIFATNHPFKLDDAITNRVGINVEFTLPEQPERMKILYSYLHKFAQENKNAVVTLSQDMLDNIHLYAEQLEGIAPRAIKFVAEEMVVRARRNKVNPILSDTLAQEVLSGAKETLKQTAKWETERELWIEAQRGGLNKTPVAAAA